MKAHYILGEPSRGATSIRKTRASILVSGLVLVLAVLSSATLAAQASSTSTGAAASQAHQGMFDVRGKAPSLINFTTEADAQELAKTRKVVYFFAASWCSLCQADMTQFKARTSELPADLTLVVVDFDNADELRTRYSIPLQDVFLQINPKGERISLWVGGGIAAIKRNLK